MPERPDLEYVVPILDRELRGRSFVDARATKPVVLRAAAADIRGEVRGVARRAQCVVFDLGARELVVNPMLAGRFQLDRRDTADLALALSLDDGRVLRYRDDVSMGKVYLVAPGAPVPGLERVGIDVLSPAFTREAFRGLAKGRRDQAKVFLMDKAALDAMGNAYADEVLWAAGLHPKRPVRGLSGEELDRLHDAIVEVLDHARRTIAERAPPIETKLRDFLRVRGRKGEPCPRCGAKIRTAGVHGHDASFCPVCQPDVGGKGIVDWGRGR